MGAMVRPGATLVDVVKMVTEERDEKNPHWTFHDYEVEDERGERVIWGLWEHRDPPEGHPGVFITCDLVVSDGSGKGYKSMDETVSPFYYSCPIRFLEKAPVCRPKWRVQVYKAQGRTPPEILLAGRNQRSLL